MDFNNRSTPGQHPGQHQDAGGVATPGINSINTKHSGGNNKRSSDGRWTRIGIFGAFFAVVILIVGLIVLVAANNNSVNDKTEATYIKSNKLQAVFLNTGQVYFGNINSLNNNYLTLSNIYYLQTASNGSATAASTANTNSNVTLVKLGCELHKPLDQMVINRSQVTFWENLDSSGQVSSAVAKYQAQNPTHKCVDQSTSAGTSTGNAAQGATGNTAH